MTIRRTMGACIVALALGSIPGCLHRGAAPPTSPAVSADDPMMHLRRDDAALRRRVQMLEDRVLYLEQRGGGASGPTARESAAGAHVLPDGRALPVVRLAPQHAAAAPPRRVAPRSPTSAAAEPDAMAPVEAVPEQVAPSRRFRLEGSRLVELTTRNGPAAPDRPSRSGRGEAIVREYEAAMAIYQSGQPERAESSFDAFARKYPRHDYADNALYWKGESAYDQRHYADALASFTEVVERYGGGNKAPDALLKIGLCYRQLNDLPNARDVLGELIAAYPAERASDIARVKLAELESPT